MPDLSLHNRVNHTLLRALAACGALALFVVGILASNTGFNEIYSFRTLERVPLTTIIGSVGGESQLNGHVMPASTTLTSPQTNTTCVYYRYLVEEERRDSDGDTYWATIMDQTQAVDFMLVDPSNEALIKAGGAQFRIHWTALDKHHSTQGKRRYTEWRIDLKDRITVYGWLSFRKNGPELDFTTQGEYLPIISYLDDAAIRGNIGAAAILWLWAGVTCFIFMSYLVFYIFRWHKTLAFLSLVTLSVTILLFHYGARSLETDVKAGMQRVQLHHARTDKLIREMFTSAGIADGDISLSASFENLSRMFDLNEPAYDAFTRADKDRINALRISAYEVRARYLQQISRFPESYYAKLRGLDNPANVLLPPDQLTIALKKISDFTPTRSPTQYVLTLVALALVIVLAWLAFRLIRVKRMQENLPTSKSTGVVYGLTELAGRLKPESANKTLTGPVSGNACTWYRYIVQELVSTGKNSSWKTRTDETKRQPFYCEDSEGQVRVFPVKADIITKHRSFERKGKFRYIETRLEPEDDLYILGKATQDKTRGDSLVIVHDKQSPFIISNYTESEVMFFKASQAMLLLSVGISALFLASLWISGSNGSFSALDFLLLSGVGPAFLLIEIVILMYNDLVFLRGRCDRNWANIEVSLKKRSDLVPRLQKVVEQYLSHESSLQLALTELREKRKNVKNTHALDDFMAHEHNTIEKLRVTVERYPELKGNEVIADLMQRLIRLENEIAMIRAGYNDSVMLYNTRIETFPDNLVASKFTFPRKENLHYEVPAHSLVAFS